MGLIHAALLGDWANLNAARDNLGELLRKLIHANTDLPCIQTIRFLAHESNQLSGWDGILECKSRVPWIPSGTSVWELGTGSNARQKSRDDFADRCEKELPSGWDSSVGLAILWPQICAMAIFGSVMLYGKRLPIPKILGLIIVR